MVQSHVTPLPDQKSLYFRLVGNIPSRLSISSKNLVFTQNGSPVTKISDIKEKENATTPQKAIEIQILSRSSDAGDAFADTAGVLSRLFWLVRLDGQKGSGSEDRVYSVNALAWVDATNGESLLEAGFGGALKRQRDLLLTEGVCDSWKCQEFLKNGKLYSVATDPVKGLGKAERLQLHEEYELGKEAPVFKLKQAIVVDIFV